MNNDSLDLVLEKIDLSLVRELQSELDDTWNKKQMFRTETEMRVSVLNDIKFPTSASKYWQAIREQAVMLENLVMLSFEYRRNDVKLRRKKEKLSKELNNFKKEELQIDIDECEYIKKSTEQTAHHRVREIEHWSRIKKELDDGTFDTQDVNTHQADSYHKRYEIEAKNLTPGTPFETTRNVMAHLETSKRLRKEKTLLPK